MVFLTAYYALVDLAGLRAGESVLIHAAAGGVGMAAVQLARHLGARVFGTASPGKWAAVRRAGRGPRRTWRRRGRRSSRSRSGRRPAGRGVDVVLDSLAGEFVDASLRLTAPGGRFIEMGKTDIRDPARGRGRPRGGLPGLRPDRRSGPDRIARDARGAGRPVRRGVLAPLPVTCWDVRRAPEAFRYLSQARHIGKVVLTIPAPARAGRDGAGHRRVRGAWAGWWPGTWPAARAAVTWCWRPGAARPRRGWPALAAELAGLGARVQVTACDAADRAALAAVIAAVPADAPLPGVVHAAGVLDDGVIGSLTPARVDAVMRPKADGGLAPARADRATWTWTCSCCSPRSPGCWGSPGQGNYAAANTFLDALAAHRRGLGLAAISLAWGPWQQAGGMTGQLDRAGPAADGPAGVPAAGRPGGPGAAGRRRRGRGDAAGPGPAGPGP